ncbi:MAG: hypothetical protein V4622_04755 [Bacteroidota bacterium]
MKISWSKTAEKDFEENIIYLLEDWSEAVVFDFTTETERILKIISKSPKTFQKHKVRNIHRVVLTKQITLFYKVKSDRVELLRFWNNYKNPKKNIL